MAAKAKKLASHLLEAAEHDLELAGGEVRVLGAPQLSVKLAELARILKGAPGYGFPPDIEPGLEARVDWRTDALAYANACHVAEVEVDPGTGGVRLVNYVAMQDSGTLINPMLVDGQVRGAVAHGIGNALFEWMGFDDSGQPVTTTFADYLLPGAIEVPAIRTLYRDAVAAQPARRQGRGRGRHHPGGGRHHLRRRGRIAAVRRAHLANPDHAAHAGGADHRGQDFVGWVERSETQRFEAPETWRLLGLASARPKPTQKDVSRPKAQRRTSNIGAGISMRTGSDYLRSLNDGRQVFVDGERVADVSRHRAFREAARSVARLYDIAAAPELRERMTFLSPATGEPVLRAYQIPRSHADLKARRLFSETWAEATFGLMGRTPDHVAGFFCGYAATAGVLAAGGQQFADNVVAYYQHMRDHHLYAAYAIVPPQIDRSKPAHKQSDPALYAGVVERARRWHRHLRRPAARYRRRDRGRDPSELHPSLAARRRGLRQLPGGAGQCAGPETLSAPAVRAAATNAFDYPLSSRFDESDSYVVFDNVFVPWEHVFIYRNLEVTRDQWWRTPSHLYGNHQAQVRYVTKLRFMIGIAQRMNEMTGNAANPAVQIMMGELAAWVSVYETMLLAHETMATIDRDGVLWPSRTALYSAMALQSELNGRMLEIIRELTGAAMITLPSSLHDFESPHTAGDIERYMRSAASDAKARVALMRLAWDFIGSEFGARHQQYEKFYGGASFLVKQNVYRHFDFPRACALVDAALNLPPVAED